MTGAIINTAAIIVGGICGHLFGKLLKDRHQETLTMACGIGTLFMGIAGAMNYMLHHNLLPSGGSMLVVGCLALGGLIGEIINIESLFERFGEWLKKKTGNARDNQFVNGFVTASLTVCIGAMAIMGSIQDGISGDLVHTGHQVYPGPDYRDGNDLLPWERLCFLRYSGIDLGRLPDAAGFSH